jgi:hypothetical protein
MKEYRVSGNEEDIPENTSNPQAPDSEIDFPTL